MASSKYEAGLININMGDIAVDGGMGTTLVALGDTVAGSATMTTSDDTITDFNIEESDSPVQSFVTAAGKITIVWSTYNASAANLYKLFGGTFTAGNGTDTPDQWDAPDTFPDKEQSLQILYKTGGGWKIPRAKISAKLNMSFKKDTLSQVDITATVLQPNKVGVRRISKLDPTV